MRQIIYDSVIAVARAHDWLWNLNKVLPYNLTDKQMHFLIIGLFGMLVFCVIHPIFRALFEHNLGVAASWFYVFTLVFSVAFAIEIGQYLTHTGTMELADVAFGLHGFLTMFGVFLIIRWTIMLIRQLFQKK